MDNFMDKLSNRFHAGELIRANGEAEARQMEELRQQNEQQTEVISEVRRLNLKTAEISEQISQMAALSIERLEEYESALSRISEAADDQIRSDDEAGAQNALDGGTGWEREMYQGLSQLHVELQNIESLESSLLAFQEMQSEHNNKLADMMRQNLEAQSRPNSWQTEVWQSMSLMQQQLQNVEQLAGSQTAFLEQLQGMQSDLENKIFEKSSVAEQNIAKQNDQIMSAIEELNNRSAGQSEKPGFVYEIEAILSEIENVAEQNKNLLAGKIDSVGEGISNVDFSSLKEELRVIAGEESKKTEQTLDQIKELVVSLRVYLDEVEKKTEDFIHKEDVKVYRNVQSVVMETVSARSRDIGERLEAVEKKSGSTRGLKPLVIVTCLFSMASLALTILQMLGIVF